MIDSLKKIITFLVWIVTGLWLPAVHAQGQSEKPNIVLILADDMGFSDLGSFGSEIKTPNLDKLAANGLRLTQFYNSGRCCPSRASLLTGLYPHQAGVGDMVQDKGSAAYQGYLNENSVTIAQLLKTAGYHTIVSGKWHVGLVPSALAHNRGFDHSFTLQNNGSSYFNSEPIYNDGRKVTFLLDGKEIQRQESSKYLTQAITDFAVQSLDKVKDDINPFFLYLAYNAPHWPIQALPEDIARYKGKYLQGWDSVRAARFQKQKELGIISKEWTLSERYENAPDWSSLSPAEKEHWDTRMAIYAAMVDRMDHCIGEVLEKLKQLKKDRKYIDPLHFGQWRKWRYGEAMGLCDPEKRGARLGGIYRQLRSALGQCQQYAIQIIQEKYARRRSRITIHRLLSGNFETGYDKSPGSTPDRYYAHFPGSCRDQVSIRIQW
jgi:hypothetical protein